MRSYTRGKRRVWIFAVCTVVVGGGVLAWHQGLLPFEITHAETGTLKPSGADEDLGFVDPQDSVELKTLPQAHGTPEDSREFRIRDNIPPQSEPSPASSATDPISRTFESGELASSFEAAPPARGVQLQAPFFTSDTATNGSTTTGNTPPARTRFPPELRNPASIGRPAAVNESPGRLRRPGQKTPETATPPTVAGLAEIDRLIDKEQYLKAHELLSRLYWNQPSARRAIQSRIDQTAYSIYLAPHPHYLTPYVVQPGDNLTGIAKGYNVPWQYLKRLNRISKPSSIRPGQKLKVIKGPFSAVIDLSEFELVIHAHGYFVHRYRVGIGKDGSTPIGTFKVLDKVENPAYFGSDGEVIKADDPRNPVGEYWIDIGNAYGIHGTIDPDSIGKAESRGCIRMANKDIAEVYGLLGLASEVRIQR